MGYIIKRKIQQSLGCWVDKDRENGIGGTHHLMNVSTKRPLIIGSFSQLEGGEEVFYTVFTTEEGGSLGSLRIQ